MAGTVGGEFNFMHYLGDKSKYSKEEVKNLLSECYGEDTERILELFRIVYPERDQRRFCQGGKQPRHRPG